MIKVYNYTKIYTYTPYQYVRIRNGRFQTFGTLTKLTRIFPKYKNKLKLGI